MCTTGALARLHRKGTQNPATCEKISPNASGFVRLCAPQGHLRFSTKKEHKILPQAKRSRQMHQDLSVYVYHRGTCASAPKRDTKCCHRRKDLAKCIRICPFVHTTVACRGKQKKKRPEKRAKAKQNFNHKPKNTLAVPKKKKKAESGGKKGRPKTFQNFKQNI